MQQDVMQEDFMKQGFMEQDLEAIMKKEIFQENRARWEVLEWMGSTQSKIIWAVVAAIVVLGIIYLIQ